MADQIRPTLVDMPKDVMREILAWCDFVSIQCLRRTSHNLRDFINNIWPNPGIRYIEITGTQDELTLVFCGESSWDLYPVDQHFKVTYRRINGGSTRIVWSQQDRHRVKTIENSNFSDFFSQDLASCLESKTKLKWITIDCDVNGCRSIQRAFESSASKIKVDRLNITNVRNQDSIMAILPYICPDTLHELKILGAEGYHDVLDLSNVVKLEQWKKTNILEMSKIMAQPEIQNYEHFPIAKVRFDEITTEKLMKIKANLLNCSSPNIYLEVFFRRFQDRDALFKSLGLSSGGWYGIHGYRETRWSFRRSDKHVLSIGVSKICVIFRIRDAPVIN